MQLKKEKKAKELWGTHFQDGVVEKSSKQNEEQQLERGGEKTHEYSIQEDKSILRKRSTVWNASVKQTREENWRGSLVTLDQMH